MNSIKPALENAVKRRFPVLSHAGRLPAVAIAAATLLATSGARAAITLPDVAEITTAIAGVVTIVSSIGIAVLGVVVTAKLFTWIRTALR
ncbi:hypothetical protein GmRootA79_40640 [Acidovorax sp. A79]|uniref:major capsid protein n=1 Tax=Acidovorax sp. A79 TaxID=3056107 RepID=UPI0034E86E49